MGHTKKETNGGKECVRTVWDKESGRKGKTDEQIDGTNGVVEGVRKGEWSKRKDRRRDGRRDRNG